jgi:hypothetical protein
MLTQPNMAPWRRDFTNEVGSDLAPTNPARIGILISIIVGGVIVASVLVYGAIRFVRSRRARTAGALNPLHPYLSKKEYVRRRKLSAVERSQEEDLERQKMIRKSLMSRNSMPSSQASFSLSIDIDFVSHIELHDEEQPAAPGLKEDWKEFEAQLHSDMSLTRERHPSLAKPAPVASPSRRERRTSSPIPEFPPDPAFLHEARSVSIHSISQERLVMPEKYHHDRSRPQETEKQLSA